jgi:hypothetical protein
MADKVFVEALQLSFSPSAADSSKTSLNTVGKLPMIFDFGPRPKAWHDRNQPPTTFATEAEAREKVDDLIARCKGIARVGQKLNRPVDIGHAGMLFGKDFDGRHFGGYAIAPLAEWEAMRDEETRVDSVVASEQLAAADSEVQRAQEEADRIRAEVGTLEFKPRPSFGASKWVATDTPRVQVYARQDGSQSYRGRKDGGVSPSFDTKEEAIGWLEGEAPPDKVSDGRTEALEAMRDVVVRS